MTDHITEISPRKASIVAGIGYLMMISLAVIARFVAFSSVIVPRKSTTTVENIRINLVLFCIGIASYLIVLEYNLAVSFALYIILKPVKKNIASLSTMFRLAFTIIKGNSLLAPFFLYPNAYFYSRSFANVFRKLQVVFI